MSIIINNQNVTKTMRQNVAVLKTAVQTLTLESKDLTSSLMFKRPLSRPSLLSIFVSVPTKNPYAEYGRRLKAIARDITTIQEEIKYGDKKSYESLVQLKGRTESALSSLKAQFSILVKKIENDLTNAMQDTSTSVSHKTLPYLPVSTGLVDFMALVVKYIKLIKDYWDDIQAIIQLIAGVVSILNAIIELAKEIVEHIKRVIEMVSNLNLSDILKQLINNGAVKALLTAELKKSTLNILTTAKNSILQANLGKSAAAVETLTKQVDSADKIQSDIDSYVKQNEELLIANGGLSNLTVNDLPGEMKNSLLANGERLGLSKYGNLNSMSVQKIYDLAEAKKNLAGPALSANVQNMLRIQTELTELKAFETNLADSYNKDMAKYLTVAQMSIFSASLNASSTSAKLAKLKSKITPPSLMIDASGKLTISGLVYFVSKTPALSNTAITVDLCLAYTEGTATQQQINYLDSMRNAPAFRDIAPALATNSGELFSEVEQVEKTVNEEFLRIAQKEAAGKTLTTEEKNFKDAAIKNQVKDPNEQINPDTQSSKPAPTLPTKEDEQNQRVENPSTPSPEVKGMPQEDLKNFVFNDTGWTPDLTSDYFTGERAKRTYLPGILISPEDITQFDKYVIFTCKLHPYQRMNRTCDLDILHDLIPIMKEELKVEQKYLQNLVERLFSSDS